VTRSPSRRIAAIIAVAAAALASSAAGAALQEPVYSLAATESCLAGLPGAVIGLPPASPPVPPALFVDALAHDVMSTGGSPASQPRAHRQLGAWYGDHRATYQGIILSFFKSVPDARASLKSLAWLYGGKRIANVVVTWDQQQTPSPSMRKPVLGCLRSKAPRLSRPPTRPASLATFAGAWGGHTRGLSITAPGKGSEETDDGCCRRVYELTFQILSVSGTLTRATAVYRVMRFKRFDGASVRARHAGDIGRLLLRNGIVTNTLTGVYFCSDPAWGATGACGA
jgi:hypothetical protein